MKSGSLFLPDGVVYKYVVGVERVMVCARV